MSIRVHHADSAPFVSLLFAVSFGFWLPDARASDSGAWRLVDPWLRLRGGLAMAYDSRRGVTVLFGGYVHYARADVHLGDTWEYEGRRWVRRSTEGPSPRHHHSMAYDSRRGVTVLFGGSNECDRHGDTWEWRRMDAASDAGPQSAGARGHGL